MIVRRLKFLASITAALITTACSNSATGLKSAASAVPPPAGSQFRFSPATNLLGNGSFEHPIVGGGSFDLFNTGTTFSHWKVTGAAGNVAIVSGTFTQGGFSFPAHCGSQWLDLTGTSNSATGVSQTFNTTAGSQHTLTFFVGNIVDPGGIFGTTSTVNVLIDGQQIFSATNSGGAGSNKLFWKKFTTGFTATGSSVTITFLNGDPSTDTNNGLDCVQLT